MRQSYFCTLVLHDNEYFINQQQHGQKPETSSTERNRSYVGKMS